MSTASQVREIVWMNLRSIPQRWGASLVVVIGIAGVVGVLVAMLSMAQGFSKTLKATGTMDRVIVLRGGANAEISSFLDRGATTLMRQDPAVARGSDGLPLASAELLVVTEVPRKGQSTGANVSLRGVEANGVVLRTELRIVEGRVFKPGLRELIVGRGAQRQFDGLDVGKTLRFRGSSWAIVGVFESGDAHESELWADVETTQAAFFRSTFSSVLLQLRSVDAFDGIKRRLTSDPQLNVDVQRERDYFSAQSQNFTNQIGVVTGIVTVIMAIGALFGALNTMYAAVSARTAEIGTLRALGFGRLPVVASVLTESLLLSLAGGVLGAAIAYGLFNGYSVSTLGQGFTQVAFNFAVTPELLVRGLFWAIGIGFVGGLAPALHAVRMPVTQALRAV